MSKLTIIKSKYNQQYHTFETEDVKNYGLEKACILGNLDKCVGLPDDRYHEIFPYIKKEEFYKLLQELIDDGICKRI